MTTGIPNGPWGFNAGGQPTSTYFTEAPYFTFGAEPYRATVANSVDGTTNMPFVPLIFMDSPWADSMLASADTSAALRSNYGIFY